MEIKKYCSIIVFFFALGLYSYAQSSLYVEGKVLDAKTKKPVPFATIQVKNQKLGLYASEEGGFSFRMRNEFGSDALIISSIGYKKIVVPFSELKQNRLNVLYLQPSLEQLDEITIVSSKKASRKDKRIRSRPKSLIREAIKRIPVNHPSKPFTQVAYYRDYLKRKGNYYNLNEAIVQTEDAGFETLFTENKFRLMYYTQSKDFPVVKSIPEEYDSIWQGPMYHATPKKFLPYTKVPNHGGNELFLLLAHDPIRNYELRSFSFIDRLAVDFLKNHSFEKPVPVLKDDLLLYKVRFRSEKIIPHLESVKEKKLVIATKSHFKVNSQNEEVSDAVIVKGDIYINPEDYTIHRLNYDVDLKSTMKRIYGLSLEYGYSDASETTMKLNYISFNNEFFTIDESDLNSDFGDRERTFRLVSQERKNACLQLFMNNPVDAKSAQNRSNYEITTGRGKIVPIKKITVQGNSIKLYPFEREDLNNKLNVVMKKVKDVNGKVVNRKSVARYYQYRELFVQEFDTEIEFTKKCFIGNLPLRENCVSRSPDLKKYLINSPLSTNENLK